MLPPMNSRERLMAAINCRPVDFTPMAFMIFTALKKRLEQKTGRQDPAELIHAQLDLGLDTFVDLRQFSEENEEVGHSDAPGFPVRFGPEVKTEVFKEKRTGNRYPLLHKNYRTPAGDLTVSVNQTEDWPYGKVERGDYQIPFMDDFLAPRCNKYLIERKEDLPALKHLLAKPWPEDLEKVRENWETAKKMAQKNDLLVTGGWGVGADALAWFCGLENAVMMALLEPDFFREVLHIINAWNRPRMEVFLDYGVDLFIRRAWYEGTDFWSPELYTEFFAPIIKKEVELTHGAGAKYGYILTSGSMDLHEILFRLGVDVLIGADPVQGKGTDLAKMKDQLKGKMCIWGGVNGFVTVEEGEKQDIEKAVISAMEKLGPEGFILSPVDNVRDSSDQVWEKILIMINTWKNYR